MSEIKFSKNFSDHSVHSGTDAGFQFEFYCATEVSPGTKFCPECGNKIA